jgi:hypothetical protein
MINGPQLPRPPRRRWLSGCTAAGALVLLTLGTLDLHPPGEPLAEHLAGLTQEVYYTSGAHPTAPHHLDAAQPAFRPFCPACLNRLQAAGAHCGQLARLLAPVVFEKQPLAASAIPVERAAETRSARAPPLACPPPFVPERFP